MSSYLTQRSEKLDFIVRDRLPSLAVRDFSPTWYLHTSMGTKQRSQRNDSQHKIEYSFSTIRDTSKVSNSPWWETLSAFPPAKRMRFSWGILCLWRSYRRGVRRPPWSGWKTCYPLRCTACEAPRTCPGWPWAVQTINVRAVPKPYVETLNVYDARLKSLNIYSTVDVILVCQANHDW